MAILELLQHQTDAKNEIAYREPQKGSADIKVGAQLIVQENQWAVFYRDGKALDTFSSGRHTLTTLNLPLISKVIGKPWGDSPFQAHVYFMSRALYRELKWGTPEPMMFPDKQFGVVPLRAFGEFSMRVSDSQLFLQQLVHTQSRFVTNDIENYLKKFIVTHLNDIMGETLETFTDLPKYQLEISGALKASVADDFGKVGIELVDFTIGAISPPEDLQEKIKEAAGVRAFGVLLGGDAASRFQQVQVGKAVVAAASNEGEGGNAASLGLGAGIGFMMPGMMAGAMQQGAQGAAPPGAPGAAGAAAGAAAAAAMVACPKCNSQVAQGAKFCSSCGNPMPAPASCSKCNAEVAPGVKFCSSCGNPMTAAPASCPSCKAELAPGAKFCGSCGHKME